MEEYKAFDAAMKAHADADGEWYESGKEADNYSIMNAVGEGEGFTMAEMQQIMGPWMAKFTELKNADEAAAQ